MNKFKKLLINNAFTSLLTTRVFSILLHIHALYWRVKSYFFCHVAFSAKIIGWKNLKLGCNSVISGGTWINVNNRDSSGNIQVNIGKNVFIGRDNFFTVGKKITVGPYCLTATNCSFIGSSHIISDPFKFYMTTGVTNDWEIIVGANCFFGYGASVVGNVEIGHGCVIGAHCKVMNNIPPFSMVVGNPAVIIKRYDFEEKKWSKDFDSLKSWPSEDEYIRILEESLNGKYPFMPLSVSNDFFGDTV